MQHLWTINVCQALCSIHINLLDTHYVISYVVLSIFCRQENWGSNGYVTCPRAHDWIAEPEPEPRATWLHSPDLNTDIPIPLPTKPHLGFHQSSMRPWGSSRILRKLKDMSNRKTRTFPMVGRMKVFFLTPTFFAWIAWTSHSLVGGR